MADQRVQYNEVPVGANHPSKADTLNRLALIDHNTDGTHKNLNLSGELVLGGNFAITGLSGIYQDTTLIFVLPSAGTYFIYGNVCSLINAATLGDYIATKLYDATDAADIAGSMRYGVVADIIAVGAFESVAQAQVLTVTAAKTIKLYAARIYTGTAPTTSYIMSDAVGKTVLGYIKLI